MKLFYSQWMTPPLQSMFELKQNADSCQARIGQAFCFPLTAA